MSLRRTPGVVCQCQTGAAVDEGTLIRALTGPPGPTTDHLAAHTAARAMYQSVAQQTPMCMPWESVRAAAQFARSGMCLDIETTTGLSLEQAVYGFAVRQVAQQYLDVREDRKIGDNRGAEVESLLGDVGVKPGNSWCAAFVYHCHLEAANFLCADTTCPRTASSVYMVFEGRAAGNATFSRKSVLDGANTPVAGDVFVKVNNGGRIGELNPGKPKKWQSGHTGIVVSYEASSKTIITIEGNSNTDGSANGVGVFMLHEGEKGNENVKRMKSQNLWGFMRPRVVWL